jgi:hypothetical protein
MTRTDRRGRPLKAFLQAEIVGADVTIEEVRRACGLTRASYYGEPSGTGRGFDDSFPNSEELRQVAEYYSLGDNGWVSLLVEFGWLQPQPGTLRMPFTADKSDGQFRGPIGLVAVRDLYLAISTAQFWWCRRSAPTSPSCRCDEPSRSTRTRR